MNGRFMTRCRRPSDEARPPLPQTASPVGAHRRGPPLALTSLSGAIYGTILYYNIDAPWLLRLHTGNFGVINLQPFYSPLIGILTLVLVISGISLLLKSGRTRAPIENQP